MPTNILTLAQQLISIKSNPDNKDALSQALELCLSHLQEFTIERFECDGVLSALIYNTPSRPPQFKIILNGHLDVIPGKDYQYAPQIKGDKLYGAGAMDMKSNVATMLFVFKNLAKKLPYPIALQLVTDEEIGGFKGTKYQIDQGVRADFVIAGETTNFDIVNQAKGINWINITCRGKTAHGAYPHRGDNAIWQMIDLLNKLKAHYPLPQEQLWDTTVNLAQITTDNKSFNKIPDMCQVSLDIREPPQKQGQVVKWLQNNLPPTCQMELVADEPALYVADDILYLTKLQQATKQVTKKQAKLYGAQGSSDARHYMSCGGAGVEFGPLGGGIGTDDEWVSISSLHDFAKILERLMKIQMDC